jgi:RNA polymerase sigma factor (sigma-70 family)
VDRCDFPDCDCAARTKKFLGGDRAACDEMINRLKPYIRGIVRNIMGSARPQDCDDAVQDVLLKVFAGIGLWKEQCPFCFWVRHVAIRRALDLRRSAQARIRTASLPASYDIADPRSPTFALDLEDCTDKVLAGVPAEWRQVFDRIYKEEVSAQRVADEMNTPIRTVYHWLSQIRERIRTCMERK